MQDVLGELIERTRMHGRVFCQSTARAPWGRRFPFAPHSLFHLITAGNAELLVGWTRLSLAQGDLVLLARGDGHVLADHEKSARVDLADRRAAGRGGAGPARRGGRSGPETRVRCGVYDYDGLGSQHPVLRLLPAILHVPGPQLRASSDLSATLDLLVREHAAPARGGSVVVSRLLDIMFVQTDRLWATLPDERTGWIGALTDEMLARALGAMHADLGRAWTVDTLAHAAGTSRATLGRRFVAEVGEPLFVFFV